MAIKDFINKLEDSKISFWEGAFLIYIVIFIRTFLENYANSSNLYHITGIIDTFFGYPAWFSIIFLSIFIIARILTKEKIAKIAKIVALFSFIIIIPPIIDLIVNKGNSIPYIFISGSYSILLKSFLAYFGGGAIGIGIKTEVLIVLAGFGFYIFHKTKEVKRAVIGMLLLYSTIFVILASPTFILGFKNAITNEHQSINMNTIVDFYYHKEPLNAATTNRTFIADVATDNNFYSPLAQKTINQYSITFAIIFLLINIILMGWYLFLYSSKKFFAVLKNFRYLRIFHYFLMISVGIYLGTGILGKNPVGSLFDLMSFISLFLALLFAWLFSVWENDEVDIEVDKISNQNRPLTEIESSIPLKNGEI